MMNDLENEMISKDIIELADKEGIIPNTSLLVNSMISLLIIFF